jgi:hypothetical protein
MFNKITALLLSMSLISYVKCIETNTRKSPIVGEYKYSDGGIYDADFWEGFDKEEEPYEHDWLHIPDFINKTEVGFWFNLTHHFLNGVDRGIYMNDTVELDKNCFGDKYVTKINELAAMFKDNFFYNIIPALALMYQLWYMFT